MAAWEVRCVECMPTWRSPGAGRSPCIEKLGGGHAQLATPESRGKGRIGRGVVSPEGIEVIPACALLVE